MTDKEKLLAGIKMIQKACHGEEIVEDLCEHDISKYSKAASSRIMFMIAEGWEREPVGIEFDEAGNFVQRF